MTQPILEKTALKAEPDGRIGSRTNLIGLDREELAALLASLGMEKFRTKQVWHWLYHRGVTTFDAMTTLAKPARELLASQTMIERLQPVQDLISTDGTRKWLFKLSDGNEIETVYIPTAERGTLCISSQVGCTLACTFCYTGTQALVRNLTAAEIVGQVLAARTLLNPLPSEEGRAQRGVRGNGTKDSPHPSPLPKGEGTRAITNIVFMGMGEPLFNYDHVKKACAIMMDGEGLSLSRRHITISTSGVVPRMKQMSDELGVNLAVSLHAVRDDLRNEIVPINRKYQLPDLLDAMRYHHAQHPSRRILIEYVMLGGVNDSDEDAHTLAKLLDGIPSKVNLIPFNPWPKSPYACSSGNRIHAFKRILQSYHLSTPIRKTRGQDILAACGQLKSESERKKGEKVKRV